MTTTALDVAGDLLRWYDRHRRDLPWRRDPSPYKTLVSELMLQQTGVATVVPHFLRFVARFPDLPALARAGEAEVTAAWSGLGYYARARNLHRAARAVVERHAGRLPREEDVLRTLPGIGPYTAAAVAAIAFDERAFALDGNAVRVLARLVGEEGPTDRPAVRARLRSAGLRAVPDRRAGDFAQSVMELGATVCRPRRPMCAACPLAARCAAAASGRAELLPRRGPRADKERVAWVALRIRVRGFAAVTLRERGLLAGTWMVPSAPFSRDESCGADLGAAATLAVASSLARAVGVDVGGGAVRRGLRPVGEARHVFTHRDLVVSLFEIEVARRAALPAASDGTRWRWLRCGARRRVDASSTGAVPTLAVSSLGCKLLELEPSSPGKADKNHVSP